ncbi:MAG: hypothetical protein HFH12_05435 [Dorea sp.]|nr:hypothetical protein [Dorea sp.]
MEIQTAGQQKYYDFIEERAKSLRLGMIIWISLLAAALLAILAGGILGYILAILGVSLGALNIRSQMALRSKLDRIPDKEDFFNQLLQTETVEIPEYRLMLTKDYVLLYRNEVFVYLLKDMEKVEVGIRQQGEYRQKTLFLTDKAGERNEIAVCGRKEQERAFDLAYHTLHDRVC